MKKRKILVAAMAIFVLSMLIQPVAAATFEYDAELHMRGYHRSHPDYDWSAQEQSVGIWLGWYSISHYFYWDDLPDTYNTYKLKITVQVNGEPFRLRAEWWTGRPGIKKWGYVWTLSSSGTHTKTLADPPSGATYLYVNVYDAYGIPDLYPNTFRWNNPIAILT